jgi:hypothetical protein
LLKRPRCAYQNATMPTRSRATAPAAINHCIGGRFAGGLTATSSGGTLTAFAGVRFGVRRPPAPGVLVKPSARNCSEVVWLGSTRRRICSVSLWISRDFRAWLNSRMSAKRSSRFFASMRSKMSWKNESSGGNGGAGCVRCAINTAIGVSARNGGAPVSSS